jgi:hypothetical protein
VRRSSFLGSWWHERPRTLNKNNLKFNKIESLAAMPGSFSVGQKSRVKSEGIYGTNYYPGSQALLYAREI